MEAITALAYKTPLWLRSGYKARRAPCHRSSCGALTLGRSTMEANLGELGGALGPKQEGRVRLNERAHIFHRGAPNYSHRECE